MISLLQRHKRSVPSQEKQVPANIPRKGSTLSTSAVLTVLAQANRRESERAKELASWLLDWPNVNYRHHPKEAVPGVNLHEEYARYIARQSSGWDWTLGILVPKLIIARDLESAPRSLETFCRIASAEGNSITRQNILPGVLLGMFESYGLFRDYVTVDRIALDAAISRAATFLLLARVHGDDYAVRLSSDPSAGKEYRGRMASSVGAWVHPGNSGVSPRLREPIVDLIRSLKSQLDEGSVPRLPHQCLLRQVCLSALGDMELSGMMKILLAGVSSS